MRYELIINDDEARDNGDEATFADKRDEVMELLRSGYIEVEHFAELSDG